MNVFLPGSQKHWDQACQMLYTYVHGSQTTPSSEHIGWKCKDNTPYGMVYEHSFRYDHLHKLLFKGLMIFTKLYL